MAFGLDLGNLLVHLRGDESQFVRSMDNAEKKLRAVSDKLTSIGRKMTMRVTAPIVGMGAMVTKTFASFDDAMTKSLAIMGDISPTLRKEMERVAIDISKKSVTSATNLAKSYFYLASAGLSAQQSVAALNVVERFAVAGAFDMALATDLITDAQSALGLTVKDTQKNMENMSRVTDVLIGANTLANASTQQFSEALMRAGPAMKAYDIELEEGVAVLAAYADQGKKAAEGGELFGRMLRLIIKGFVDNRNEWNKFGVSIVDTNDKMRPLADIVRDLTSLLSGMGVTQKASTLMMMGFQARSQQTILPLLGMGDAIERYNKRLLQMKNITQEIYEKQLRSFASQMKIVWNNVKAAGMSMGEIVAPAVLKLNEYVLKATVFWDSLNESVRRNVILYAGVAAAIGPVLLATGLLFKSLAFMAGTLRTLRLGFVLLGAAISAPLVAILAFVAIAYVLRAAWVQNLKAVKDRMQEWFNYFKEGFDWLIEGPVGETVKFFAKAWTETFNYVKKEFGGFLSDIAGAWAGIRAYIKGDDWAQAFVDAKERADVALTKFNKSIVTGYKTTTLVLSAFGEATVESLEDLMDAVKTQFGEDADAIISLIESKISALQKMPVSPHEQLRLMMGTPEVELEKIKEEIENVRAGFENVNETASEGAKVIGKMLRELDTEYSLLGKINEERKRAVRLEKFREAVMEEHAGDLEKINELMTQYSEKLDKIMSGRRGISAFTVQMKQWASDATNIYQGLGEVATRAFDDMASSLSRMLMRGRVDFKAFARSVVGDLITIIMRAQMAQVAMSLFPGLFATAPAAAPALANFGGTAPSGLSYIPAGQGPGGLQRGGEVEKTGWAVVHEGEQYSGVNKKFDKEPLNIEIHMHNEGTKQEITKAEQYVLSDQRIIDVWTQDATSSVSGVARTVKKLAGSR